MWDMNFPPFVSSAVLIHWGNGHCQNEKQTWQGPLIFSQMFSFWGTNFSEKAMIYRTQYNSWIFIWAMCFDWRFHKRMKMIGNNEIKQQHIKNDVHMWRVVQILKWLCFFIFTRSSYFHEMFVFILKMERRKIQDEDETDNHCRWIK